MPHIILLHGAIGAQDQLDPLAEMLEPYYTLHRFNFSGHGGAAFADAFSLEHFTTELIRFTASLPPQVIAEGVTVFGYSMGGYVAMLAGLSQPTLFNRIITLATKWDWDEASAQREINIIQPEKILEKIPSFAHQLERRHSPHHWKLLLQKTATMLEALGRHHPLQDADLSRLTLPVLVLLGDRDKTVTLDETVNMYKRLPNAALGVLPDSAHPFEKMNIPMLCQHILLSWVKREW